MLELYTWRRMKTGRLGAEGSGRDRVQESHSFPSHSWKEVVGNQSSMDYFPDDPPLSYGNQFYISTLPPHAPHHTYAVVPLHFYQCS